MIWYLLLAGVAFVYGQVYEVPQPVPRAVPVVRTQHAY